MIDICYVGNSSNDKIILNKKVNSTLGGSCIYSSFSSRVCFDGTIGVISKIDNETLDKFNERKIEFFGKVVDKMSEFLINESKAVCESQFYNNDLIDIKTKIDVNHLHISFRKGVDVENILESKNLKFNHLSIDVMIHSVEDFIPLIKKYSSKIEILFCNIKEYNVLKKYVKDIPLIIITNENKPVLAIMPTNIKSYYVSDNLNIKSSTGAGDTFIGGFLSKYVCDNNLDECISQGIYNSYKALENIGPLKNEKITINKIIKPIFLPNNLIVIGNSCSGKTTFIKYFKNNYNIYCDIDDLEPLLETFMIDDLLHHNKIKEFKNVKEKLNFTSKIWNEYAKNINLINYYTKPASSGKGHDIIRPILWDYILQMATANSESNNIIQFSRGKDDMYESEFSENAYFRGIKGFINNLPNNDNSIIINLVSNLDIRKKRNKLRFINGGHYVSDETMENVYAVDIFKYTKTGNNYGYFEVNKIKIPVYTIINDKPLDNIELNKFFEQKVSSVIKYYNNFKEKEKWN